MPEQTIDCPRIQELEGRLAAIQQNFTTLSIEFSRAIQQIHTELQEVKSSPTWTVSVNKVEDGD